MIAIQCVVANPDYVETLMLEVGCGPGNFVLPLLREFAQLCVVACDFSPRAVRLLETNAAVAGDHVATRCRAVVCDVAAPECGLGEPDSPLCPEVLPAGAAHLVSLVFVLSAVPPERHLLVLRRLRRALRSEGRLLFRDYALHDHAQLRFGRRGAKLAEQQYVRQDGTLTYFFRREELLELLAAARLRVVRCEYVNRRTENHKEQVCVRRRFLQAVACPQL